MRAVRVGVRACARRRGRAGRRATPGAAAQPRAQPSPASPPPSACGADTKRLIPPPFRSVAQQLGITGALQHCARADTRGRNLSAAAHPVSSSPNRNASRLSGYFPGICPERKSSAQHGRERWKRGGTRNLSHAAGLGVRGNHSERGRVAGVRCGDGAQMLLLLGTGTEGPAEARREWRRSQSPKRGTGRPPRRALG